MPYPAHPQVVGWFPTSEVNVKTAQLLTLPLPRAALEDSHLHLLFYFVAAKKSFPQTTWKIPDVVSAGKSQEKAINFHLITKIYVSFAFCLFLF